MCGNFKVMRINTTDGIYAIENSELIPYQLKGKITDTRNLLYGHPISQVLPIMNVNYSSILAYLANRILSIDRKNSKQILNCLNLSQGQSMTEKAKISLICRSVSVLDNYWLKTDDENVRWEDINVRENSLNKTVAHVALHGSSLTLQGMINTPELTTHGAYAKYWKRENGGLYLIKAGNNQGTEPKLEIQSSRVLDKTNVRHVIYEQTISEGLFCSKCKCMTNNKLSIIDARELYEYCSSNGYNFDKIAYSIDGDTIYKMGIVDYIIGNSDRHKGNWGFYYDSQSMRIMGCHPLYDHNNSFNAYVLSNDDAEYAYNQRNMLEWARYCTKHTDFRFNFPLKRSDFYYSYHCDAVIERAAKLGIAVKAE